MRIATWAICPRRCATTCCASAGATATTRSFRPSQAIEWFDLDAIGRAPARFDFAKLDNLNAHYMRETDDARLAALATPFLEQALGRSLEPAAKARLQAAMPGLKPRAKTLVELADMRAILRRAATDPDRRQGKGAAGAGQAPAVRAGRGARRRRMECRRARGRNARFCRGARAEARRRRPAVARGVDRQRRLAADLRRDGSARPRRKPWPARTMRRGT